MFSLANIIIKELSLELKARSRAISDDALSGSMNSALDEEPSIGLWGNTKKSEC
jgi:hypothetical protein